MREKIADFHSHILPGMDDGSGSVEESLAMLRLEADQGIGHVVATPHFDPRKDNPEAFLKRRDRAEALLRSAMEGMPELPKLTLGAEVYYFPGMGHSARLEALTVSGTRTLLVEMPAAPWEEAMYRDLEALSRQGLLPVIAHIDRYIGPFRRYGIPKRLENLPVLVQANASFFLKPATAGLALGMLEKQQIHLLGSDCHDLTSRPPNLGAALQRIRKKLGEEALEAICRHQSRAFRENPSRLP